MNLPHSTEDPLDHTNSANGKRRSPITILRDDALVFEGGNVVIDLGVGREGIMVVHSEILAQHSDWFEAAFSNRWNTVDAIDTRESSERVWLMEPVFDFETRQALLKFKVSI